MNLNQYSQTQTRTQTQSSLLATHKVLRNTYFLLSMTFMFSAACAYFALQANIKMHFGITLIGMFGLLFLTQALRNSAWGVVSTFAFTGFMGLTLGPMLNGVLHSFSNGSQLVMTSLGATGFIFLSLSAYVLTSKKDFSYMGGFLFAAVVTAFIAGIGAMLFQMPMLHLVVSGAFILIASGYILFTTSQIIHGGETNYILATVSLYVALFNLFVNLLNILSLLAGNRD